jgi:AraC-like DNA-binding protein
MITTDSVDEPDRFEFWREVVCRLAVEMEARPLAAVRGFRGTATATTAGAVLLTHVSVQPTAHVATRTPATIARANEQYFVIGLALAGACRLVQGERTAALCAGDFALSDTSRPYALHIDGPLDLLLLRIPQERLQVVLPRAHAATAVTVSGQAGSATLVRPLLAGLISAADSGSPAAQQHRVAAAIELVAASLAEITSLPIDAPPRLAHLVRAKQFIEENLGDRDLSPEVIARAAHLSSRYLQELFHDEGTSVARYLMRRRLDRAHQDLTDPRLAHLPVAEVAARLGFKRPSHFAYVFRTRFGLSPREHRNTARER